MIPLKPKSVKVTPELNERIRKIAQKIDYSDSQLIAIGMKAILDLIEAPGPLVIPRIVVMARAALNYDKSPPEFTKPKSSSLGKAPPCKKAPPLSQRSKYFLNNQTHYLKKKSSLNGTKAY